MRPWLCSNDHPREAGGTSVTHIANAHRTTIARPTKLPTFLLYSTVPVAQSAAVSLNLGHNQKRDLLDLPSVIPSTPSNPLVEWTIRIPRVGANGDRLNWPRLLAYGADSARLFRAYLAVTAWLGRSAKRGHPITRQIAAPVHGPDGKLARRRKGGAVHVHASQEAAGNLGGLAVPILRGGQRAQAVGRHGRIILVADNQGRPAAPLEQSVAQVLLDGARMDRDGMEAWMDRWRESLWAQALARVRAGERPLFTADEEAVQASHVQQHMSGSSDLVDDMVAGVAAAIDADHEAGARGISL